MGTLALGFLGLLVSANLLTGGMTRNLRQIRAEADLLAVLPDSTGKRELAQLVEQSVREYVEDVRLGSFWTSGSRRFASRRGTRHTLRLFGVWTLLPAYLLGATLSLRSDEPVWWPAITTALALMGVAFWVAARRATG